MTHRRWLLLVAIGAVVVVAAIGGIMWRVWMDRQEAMTLDQAGIHAERYVNETVTQLPGRPVPQRANRGNLPCDDPADRAPAGSAEYIDMYDLRFEAAPDNPAVFDRFTAYWTGRGFKVISADPATLATRATTLENPHDGFRLTLSQGAVGNLGLDVSSPCLPPGSGTATP